MPRIREIASKTDLPEDKQHIFDEIVAAHGMLSHYAVLLNDPELAARMSALRLYLFYENSLPPSIKTLATLVGARESDSPRIWGSATEWCRAAGVREEVIDIVGHRRPLDSLTEEEALVIRFGREMLGSHQVSDATYDAAMARFGNRLMIDLVTTLGFYIMMGLIMNALNMVPRPEQPQLPVV